MILLQQNSDCLIGSRQDISALETKENARILTISDTHGDSSGLVKIIQRFGPDCDGLMIAGDCSRDLQDVLETANIDKEFRAAIPPVLAFVRGNGDPEYFPVNYDIYENDSEKLSHPKNCVYMPTSVLLTVNEQKLFLCHGHLHGVDYGYGKLGLESKLRNAKCAVYGHTHIAENINIDGYTFVNPGSISRPRGGQPKCFSILTIGKNFIDTAFLKINDSKGTEDSYKIFQPIY